MKPAERLEALLPYIKGAGLDGKGAQHVREARDLLNECGWVLADLIEWDNREGRDPWEPLIKNARATLAKLRGEQ